MTVAEVIPAAATARTKPKSAIFTSPSSEIKTFSGLTSRCTSPARCAAADQPGILQPGDRAGLELEAGQELVVVGVARVHHLKRDRAVEPGIQAAVNRRRTAAGDFCLDEVAPFQQGAVQRVTPVS